MDILNNLEVKYGECINEALRYFLHEIGQMKIMKSGVLSDSYRDYLNKKESYYKLAYDSILKTSRGNIVRARLQAVKSGAKFGELDIYSTDCIYEYKLIRVHNESSGEITVIDTSRNLELNTTVMCVAIKGIDF